MLGFGDDPSMHTAGASLHGDKTRMPEIRRTGALSAEIIVSEDKDVIIFYRVKGEDEWGDDQQ